MRNSDWELHVGIAGVWARLEDKSGALDIIPFLFVFGSDWPARSLGKRLSDTGIFYYLPRGCIKMMRTTLILSHIMAPESQLEFISPYCAYLFVTGRSNVGRDNF